MQYANAIRGLTDFDFDPDAADANLMLTKSLFRYPNLVEASGCFNGTFSWQRSGTNLSHVVADVPDVESSRIFALGIDRMRSCLPVAVQVASLASMSDFPCTGYPFDDFRDAIHRYGARFHDVTISLEDAFNEEALARWLSAMIIDDLFPKYPKRRIRIVQSCLSEATADGAAKLSKLHRDALCFTKILSFKITNAQTLDLPALMRIWLDNPQPLRTMTSLEYWLSWPSTVEQEELARLARGRHSDGCTLSEPTCSTHVSFNFIFQTNHCIMSTSKVRYKVLENTAWIRDFALLALLTFGPGAAFDIDVQSSYRSHDEHVWCDADEIPDVKALLTKTIAQHIHLLCVQARAEEPIGWRRTQKDI